MLIYPSGELPQSVALSIDVAEEGAGYCVLVARSSGGTIYGIAHVRDAYEHLVARAVWGGQLGRGDLVGDNMPEWLLNG